MTTRCRMAESGSGAEARAGSGRAAGSTAAKIIGASFFIVRKLKHGEAHGTRTLLSVLCYGDEQIPMNLPASSSDLLKARAARVLIPLCALGCLAPQVPSALALVLGM